MRLKPLSEMLKLSKEKLEEILAPTRVRKMKATADLESAKLEEQAAGLEQEIATLATAKDIDFAKLTDKMDELALTNRKITQLDEIIAQLFPPASQTGLAD